MRAQGLVQGLFEQYLESLRRQAGIPGISAAIVAGGRIVWEKGFGYQDIDRSVAAQPDTPYPIGGITQAFSAALLLQCMENGELDLDAPMRTWAPNISEAGATVRQVLSHTSSGGYRYDPNRFAMLTPVVDECADAPYRRALAADIFDYLAMRDSVPGQDMEAADGVVRGMFSGASLDRYGDVMRRVAAPYRGTSQSRWPAFGLDAASGAISTVRDLARFDSALADGGLVRGRTLDLAFTNVNGPFGLGWFVQNYKGYKLVWQFGVWQDAYSSLILKVPDRGLTLILLANSDGLSAPFPLTSGDVTASPFARVFLSVYL
jgi:CubicO group peptidase (beta-lactamase class C family)